ncbi:MYND-type domain-containing protein [Mycena kentingensis (nom. inval.)]|nr:MYND-type domain-containing protein [Mycena kentingensis (nom. inval.)]
MSSSLPRFSWRAMIETATAPNSTKDDLVGIIDYINSDRRWFAKCALHGAFVHLLDAELIPTAPAHTDFVLLERSWVLLSALGDQREPMLTFLPPVYAAELWPHVWKWFTFLERHQPALPFVPSARAVYEAYIAIVAAFTASHHCTRPAVEMITSTPDAVAMIARAWPYTSDGEMQPPHRAALARIAALKFVACKRISKSHDDEILRGVGGSEEDRARWVVQHLRSVSRALQSPEELDIRLGVDELGLLVDMLPYVPAWHSADTLQFPKSLDEDWLALLAAGVVGALSEALYLVVQHAERERAEKKHIANAIHNAYLFLMQTFFAPTGSLYFAEAIRHHLLHAIFLGGSAPGPNVQQQEGKNDDFGVIIAGIGLIQQLVRVEVLRALQSGSPSPLTELKEIASTDAFRASRKVAEYWTTVSAILDTRLPLLERADRGDADLGPRKMCDNLQCARVGPQTDFKRCAGCKMLSYCSEACQKTDWSIGKHKTGCEALKSLYLHQATTDLSPVDRDFIRILLDADFARMGGAISTATMETITDHPKCGPLLLELSYVHPSIPSPQVRVLSSTCVAEADKRAMAGTDAAWKEMVRRAEAGRGKIELVCVRVAAGGAAVEQRHWITTRRVLGTPRIPELRALARTTRNVERGMAVAMAQGLSMMLGPEEGSFHQI